MNTKKISHVKPIWSYVNNVKYFVQQKFCFKSEKTDTRVKFLNNFDLETIYFNHIFICNYLKLFFLANCI